MVSAQIPDGGFELELALHGPDPREVLAGFVDSLAGSVASRVDELRVATPAAGKRTVEALTTITLALGGVANLVAVVDVAYRWLGERRSHAALQPTAPPAEEQVPSVTITCGDSSLTITYPEDWLQRQAVKQFLRAHGQDTSES